ncbi:MAG: glycosyltransferase family 2 protein [Bacteroidaceae bacterium]|nr:glycosyltransferase family 2 protein [Bacteroidaceae bacterium]
MKLSVVIVSYNVKYHLEQCLRSVQRATSALESEVWVVDNASTDGSLDYLRPRFPDVHFIANTENVGFSRANNQAIRLSTGEYVLLLNPDTLVGEATLSGCVSFLDAHPEVGATGVKMLNPDGTFAPESRRGVPSPFTSFCKMSGLGTLFPRSRTFGRYYMLYLDRESPAPIEIISGAYNMLRRKALDQVGLLDEDFFMYGEDVDLSYRLLTGGWTNYYLPLPILHYKGESTVKSSYRYVSVFYNAMLIFYNKHFSRGHLMLGHIVKATVFVRAFIDMCVRLLGRLSRALGLSAPPHSSDRYLSFDFDATPVSRMLVELEAQEDSSRAVIRTYSRQTGIAIVPGGAMPYEENEDMKGKS